MKHITLPFSASHALEIIHNLDTLKALMQSAYARELKHYRYNECNCQCNHQATAQSAEEPFDDPLDF
ncbi:hypothetical protein [Glaciecola petra]|uniref:Uncharacterized protein n=1 Tax=Glaciecola petra TaxID=3075602 RepID=A0ABU2ZVJ4_9ALTE|nr:hypothetical protein [Aestuariibacter sp. P117]MDT0596673.1 hypothetical protein [Aestuariibacter sp. P117]